MSQADQQQLQWILDRLRDDALLRELGESGLSIAFNIRVDLETLTQLGQRESDPARVGAALAIDRLQALWSDVNDERLWGLMMTDLFDLVIDEWETMQQEEGPWKLVFDAHIALGRQRGWLNRIPLFAQLVGKSTPELARLNAEMASGQMKIPSQKSGGCYIATAVYGSYDCPEVWVLRRFRDEVLGTRTQGRVLISVYYSLSPRLVWLLSPGLRALSRKMLDALVRSLRRRGFVATPYKDPAF